MATMNTHRHGELTGNSAEAIINDTYGPGAYLLRNADIANTKVGEIVRPAPGNQGVVEVLDTVAFLDTTSVPVAGDRSE